MSEEFEKAQEQRREEIINAALELIAQRHAEMLSHEENCRILLNK